MNRRSLLFGLASTLAAPALVRAEVLMPVRAPLTLTEPLILSVDYASGPDLLAYQVFRRVRPLSRFGVPQLVFEILESGFGEESFLAATKKFDIDLLTKGLVS